MFRAGEAGERIHGGDGMISGRVVTEMKKSLMLLLACLLCLTAGCRKQEEKKVQALPGAKIAYAAYQYDEGYASAEGWIYEMTVSDQGQLNELKELMSEVSIQAADEELTLSRGYRILLTDAEGVVTEEMVILEDGRVSVNGMICQAENTGLLVSWLEALEMDDQNMND